MSTVKAVTVVDNPVGYTLCISVSNMTAIHRRIQVDVYITVISAMEGHFGPIQVMGNVMETDKEGVREMIEDMLQDILPTDPSAPFLIAGMVWTILTTTLFREA